MTQTVPGGRRRLDASVPRAYDVPVRPARFASPGQARVLRNVVALMWLMGTIGSTTAIIDLPVPEAIWRPSAALLTIALVIGLTHRGGGHLRIWGGIVGATAVLAAVLEANVLLTSAAAATAVIAAVWAVVITRPAVTTREVIREYAIALIVAMSGAMGVAAWNAPIQVRAFGLVVVAASLAVVLAMVWALGAGLHGLGRVHLAILAGVAVAMLAIAAYGTLLRSYGSPALIDALDNSVAWMRTTIGGVPRPLQVLVGFPALIVGVSMRATRREGWWVQVFAVLGTATVTTSLVSPGAYPSYILGSMGYSMLLGLVVGLIARKIVAAQGSSVRARRVEAQLREEPARLSALK